jgi:hypothetical protein
MAFVPGYQYDIFVSYAHVDDQPLPGQDAGWITTLVSVLKRRLAQLLGREDAYSLWMDYDLSGNVQVTPEILHVLEKCATLLIILSPGYLASEWCGRENENFLRLIQGRVRSGSRVFLIEREQVDRAERPLPLQDLKGYPFWVVDRAGEPPRILGELELDQSYYNQLNRLCFELTAELKRLRAVESNPSLVYIQIADARQLEKAQKIQQELNNRGFSAPGVENVGKKAPNTTELRYFRRSDANKLNDITETLKESNIEAKAVYVPGYEDSKIVKPRQYELWLARDALK